MTRREEERRRARQAFEGAETGLEPGMARLVEAVPELVDRAGRIRAREAGDPWAAIVPLAWRALPRFAAVTAVLALVSIGLVLFSSPATETAEASYEASYEVERLILTGSASEDGNDWLLNTLTGSESGDG